MTNPQFNFHDSTGSLLNTIDVSKSFGIYIVPPILCRRVALHNSLKNAALSPDGEGPLVKLVTGARIEDVDVETCTIFLGNGEKAVGDLIIGADGVKVFPQIIAVDCSYVLVRDPNQSARHQAIPKWQERI